MILGVQIRAARGLLGWSQSDLAKASGLALSTIKRMEGSGEGIRGTAQNVWKLRCCLEEGGVIFIDENGGGPGVRLSSRITS